METLASPNPPWPDLPDPLLELILERLPLSAYVRFPSVCRRWRSVQSSHRRRHSPSPPPMLRIPWLALYRPLNQETTISFYSLFEDKFFAVPIPFSRYLNSFSCGWLLRSSDDACENLNLFNPISGARIDLPGVHVNVHVIHCSVASSSRSNYVVFIMGFSSIFLLRWFDSGWLELNPPPGVELRRTVSCGGKQYFLCTAGDLLAVDPLATPATSRYFEMAGLDEMAMETGRRRPHFVALDEEPLLVMEAVENETSCGGITVGFEVFRADLGRKTWVKVESIGDRVLMLHGLQTVSLVAGDVGARGNCIYFSAEFRIVEGCADAPWKVFDLGTGRLTDLWLPNASHIENDSQELFMPSLC